MKNRNRMTRINDEVQRELAEILRSQVKDPRLSTMVSVLRAEVTQDLKYCKVNVSVLGDDQEKAAAMEGLKAAGGYIRHLLAERVNLRLTPQLIFKLDDSVEYSAKINRMLNELKMQETAAEEPEEKGPEA